MDLIQMENEAEKVPRMTSKVTFRRQLWPQPPREAKPDWYYINTLGFYLDGKRVWEQEIPECSLFFEEGFYDWLDVPRFYRSRPCTVKMDDHFGWYIEFAMTHAEAAKIWAILFKDHPDISFSYDAEHGGQSFKKKEISVQE